MSYFHLGNLVDETDALLRAHPSDRATHERSHSTVSSPSGEYPSREDKAAVILFECLKGNVRAGEAVYRAYKVLRPRSIITCPEFDQPAREQ